MWGWAHVRAGIVYKVGYVWRVVRSTLFRLTGGFHTLFEKQYYLFWQEEERHTQKKVLLGGLREGASKDARNAVLTAEDAGI